MQSARGERHFIGGAVVAGLIGLGALLTAPPALAGASCHYPLCSETYNKANHGVSVARNWCGNAQRLSQEIPPCGPGAQIIRLNPGVHTNAREDWDAFQVNGDCVVQYQIYSSIARHMFALQTIDRRGGGSQWVRVHNDQTAYIRSISC